MDKDQAAEWTWPEGKTFGELSDADKRQAAAKAGAALQAELADGDQSRTPFSPLVADLMSASQAMTHDATSRLIDSLTEQLDTANARELAVRVAITDLISGPYMPTPAAIERALYPSDAMIARFREPEVN